MIELQSKEFQDRCRALSLEFDALLSNDDCEAIVNNDWLHNHELPVPSIELISYFAFRIQLEHADKHMAEKYGRDELISHIIESFRKEQPEIRVKSFPRVLQHIDCYKYLFSGKRSSSFPYIHEWLPYLSDFLERPRHESLSIMSRGFLETLTLRAIHTYDHGRIHSLAEALRIIKQDERAPQTVENRVKGEISRSLPFLSEKLNRCPSRSEIMYFIKELGGLLGEDEFSEDRTPWTNAFKELGYPAEPHKIRMPNSTDSNPILALVMEYVNG